MSNETTITNIAAVDVTKQLRLTLDRIETDNHATEYELAFGASDGDDNFPTIDPDEIPALIDTLTELYRTHRAHIYRDDTSNARP